MKKIKKLDLASFFLNLIARKEKCKLENEYCSCDLIGNNTMIKLDCRENIKEDFIQYFTQNKKDYVLSQILELHLENKLVRNISNLREILSNKLASLSLIDCKIQFLNKGVFNLTPLLRYLTLIKNEIVIIENETFLTNSFESNIFELYLSMNKLKRIKRGQLIGLSNLQILCIDNNEIDFIELNSFENLKNLKYLNIQSNKIKVIMGNMFVDKDKIEILYLHQNKIENIETIPFNSLYSLKKLHLFSNKITIIKFGHFIDLHNLEELKLDKNEIVSFDIYTFIGLKKLNYLDLSGNKIKQIVNKAFDNLINLKNLELHLNDINKIEKNAFVDLENLNYLNLDHNQIFTLKDVQFNFKLNELSLRFNFLSNLDEIKSTSLKRLYISNNRIQEIHLVSVLPNLEYLDLSQNRLISIEENSFSDLKILKNLNLSGNKLDLESDFDNISYFRNQLDLESLDLSFNQIKYLDSNLTFKNLISLKALNLSYNKLKSIDSFVFGYLNKLNELNLASNNLSLLKKNCFFNLINLKMLKLSYNQINCLNFIRENENYTKGLTSLQLDYNQIYSIEENTFDSNQNLISLNLNSNPIKIFNGKAFERIHLLSSLFISNTSIHFLSLNLSLKELDLSYLTNLSISNLNNKKKFEKINLANSKINISFDFFLSNTVRYVDYSYNTFSWNDFKMLNVLNDSLEILKLKKVNLQRIEQINLKNLLNLKYLDLSFNNLSNLSQTSLEFNTNLEYLDLSSNRLWEFKIVLNKLKYLNLENNQIFSISDTLYDYFSIEILKLSNNQLETYTSFEVNEVNSQNVEIFQEIHLNQNQIKIIKYFSFIFGKLKLANFDKNNISLIEIDAFLNCRSLENLSIANNRLTKIIENNFHFLFSLISLNLSSNEISFIENSSFRNLNKLKYLDLNFNNLYSIQSDLFFGLINLKDLYLVNDENEIIFNKQSFKHLPNISTIVLNESLIEKNKCLFMHYLERDVQRNVSNKYVFYKSINLITNNFSFDSDSLKSKCDLMFHFFQFKIHFNLKTDYENDLFFDSCQAFLIETENNYNHNYRKCFQNFEFHDKEDIKNRKLVHPFLMILKNYFYLITMILLLSLLVPISCLILRFEIFSCLFLEFESDLLKIKKKNLKKLEMRVQLKKEEIKTLKEQLENAIQINKKDLMKLENEIQKLKSNDR